MTLELLSGPDLGAGYLFQLTVDRSGERPRLTVHAQEGGRDASGPASGSLPRLGFHVPTTPCPIGGRGCRHEEFEVPEAALPRARLAYNRFRFVLRAMLDQQAGAVVAPVRVGLAEVARRLAERFGPASDRWYVGGSAAALAQGVAVTPNDIDLGTDRDGVAEVGEALAEYLIEPVAATTWPPSRPMIAARAFVGTLVEGVRVEWGVSDGPPTAPDGREWALPPADVPKVSVTVDGTALRATRLEYFAVSAAVKGRRDALEATVPVLRQAGPDRLLLERLAGQAPLTGSARAQLLARFDG